MQPLSDSLPLIRRRCRRGRGVLLLFDFDGTISSIVDRPKDATLLSGWRQRLYKLNRTPGIDVGIVTGRALADIRKRVSIPGIIYAGSHGFEIARGRARLLSIGHEHHRPLKRLAVDMANTLRGIAGVHIEYKETSVAVHYRRVAADKRPAVIRRVRTTASPLLKPHGWSLTRGKRVMEIRPALAWNKGAAVLWIAEHLAPESLPCYIGDDVTDEDAFRAVGARGITVRIGRGRRSYARYFAHSIGDLTPWLDDLIATTRGIP